MNTLFDINPTPSQRSSRVHSDESLLADLNAQQREAVTHVGGPLLVVAGAGSGKTRVLTRRIAYLLAERDVLPGQILAITFTNKAAAEMRERVAELIGRRANNMWVSTFHSICVRILRREAKNLGMSSSFSIYDTDDTKRLITEIGNDFGIRRYSPRSLLTHISNWKNELIDSETAAADNQHDFAKVAADVYVEYQRRLQLANAVDFDDLIMRSVDLLRNFPDITEYYRRRFRHVLVDEYQDTNHAQYTLVRELVGGVSGEKISSEVEPAELCVVGDADQSIYAFRGATIRNIEEFERDFPDARTILLEQNYRSTQTILSAANAVIARNPGRRDKRLWTDSGDGDRIVGYVADNDHEEAAFVAQEIDDLVDQGGTAYSDVAVFYRTNNQSRVFEEIFIRLGLPYKVVGGVRFYERREVRDMLAYLRILANPEDAVSVRRVLNVPRRGIGDKAEKTVANYAIQEQISFSAALRRAAEGKIPELQPRQVKSLASFVDLWDELAALAAPVSVSGESDVADLLEAVLERTGYRAMLADSSDPQDISRLENVDELVTVAREFAELTAESLTDNSNSENSELDAASTENSLSPAADSVGEAVAEPAFGPLSAFLERVSLVADADSIPDDGDEDGRSGVVTLMTVHTAKGLEYPVVFCTGWEDGVFPHSRALGDSAELAEERRLAYVAITRARKRLYVSRALVRSAWGQPVANPASRFLAEIPEELIDWRREQEESAFSGTPRTATTWGSRSRFGSGVSGSGASGNGGSGVSGWQARKNTVGLTLATGDRVSHDKYGLGLVVATEGSGPHATVTVDFGSAGTVKLMLLGGVPMVKL